MINEEEVVDTVEEVAPVEKEEDVEEVAPVEKTVIIKTYMGKVIKSESERLVEKTNYHAVTLENGETYDLTDEQYALEVIIKE